MINFDYGVAINQEKLENILAEIKSDPFGGWYDLPENYDRNELQNIKSAAQKINQDSEYLVCIGIGGSYLGHKALIEALAPKSPTKIIYAGNSLSRKSLEKALDEVGDADFSINVISKSGTTLEPAIAFKAFKEKLVQKYGEEEAKKRIYATTDANKGALHDEAVENGYTRFVVPDNIGGRYSVLTAVGLLPLAVAGVDVDNLLNGALNFKNHPESAIKYAFTRHELFKKSFDTEILATFEPDTMYFSEWWKQLFGESEGKNGQGIFPASVVYSTDLHSLGQFVQDGRRNLFETLLNFPTDEINAKIVQAVEIAHKTGGIPVLKIDIAEYNEKSFGELIYFFELACAISAKLSGVNPFDQPGVEAYKTELKKLLA